MTITYPIIYATILTPFIFFLFGYWCGKMNEREKSNRNP